MILKWTGRVLLTILLLGLAALATFRIISLSRERETAEAAAPAAGHFVSAGETRLYVQEDGPKGGLPVVFIHGFGAWSQTWKKTTSLLAADGFHTVALDVPPFGYSDKITDGSFSRHAQAEKILKVLDTLQLRRSSDTRSGPAGAGPDRGIGFSGRRPGLQHRRRD
jgi:alpha/beta hydrolase fold